MWRSLTKTRSANFYSNQVKVLLFVVIAVLFWNSNDARRFTAKQLYNVADIVNPSPQTFGEHFDAIFGN